MPTGVYPRVCGGTRAIHRSTEWGHGLSPRVRGNLYQKQPGSSSAGSIPACAGEPLAPILGFPASGVYPRVCGGTQSSAPAGNRQFGLSPRVRGNRRPYHRRYRPRRSIPACAGEPHSRTSPARIGQVYPRVCGGTASLTGRRPRAEGLSPRVRGNQGIAAMEAVSLGSIPACAGEPAYHSMRQARARVYPRVCGGTSKTPGRLPGAAGLSPRVRGNRGDVVVYEGWEWSIPACAGEPRFDGRGMRRREVYPRVCGGTAVAAYWPQTGRGLSPRVRGNRAAA